MADAQENSDSQDGAVANGAGSGVFLIVLGVGIALYCARTYPLGSLRQMGSGAFPMGLGVLLAGLGVLVALEGRWSAPRITPPLRALGAVLLALSAFALLIERAGLAPATIVMIVIASVASGRPAPVRTVLTGLAMALVAWLIFDLALGLSIPVLTVTR